MIRRSLLCLTLCLAGCAERELLLEGERLDARGNPIETSPSNRSLPASLPSAVTNASWTQSGGTASGQIRHPALGSNLSEAWSVSIGQGNGRKHRITADPVVADGRVFAMDSRANVSAVSTTGRLLWSTDLTPSAERSDEGSGGGLAVAGNRVFATNDFGQLTALDATTGRVVWRHDFDAGATAPPTVADGIVYAVTTNATGWALSAETGRVLWQVVGAISDRSSSASPSPVIAGPLAVFPFGSGQMVSAVRATGSQAWSGSIAGQRLGRATGAFTELSGGAVFSDNRIYAASMAGRSAAFDATTGQSVWQLDEGALSPLLLAGGSLYFVTDRNQFVRIDAATGERIWAQNLGFFTRERIRRRKSIFAHRGPILAGGRLILASDDGVLRQFNPENGQLVGVVDLPRGAASNPVVAGGTLFLVDEAGTLVALR